MLVFTTRVLVFTSVYYLPLVFTYVLIVVFTSCMKKDEEGRRKRKEEEGRGMKRKEEVGGVRREGRVGREAR